MQRSILLKMRSGNISETSIKAIINSLAFNAVKTEKVRSLENLFLVEQQVLLSAYPPSDQRRLFILQELIANIITSSLFELRSRLNIRTNISEESKTEALDSLKNDSLMASTELLCWSIIYYVYVQSPLGLHIDDIATYIGFAPKTVRRHRDKAITMLTKAVWQRELQARREYHNRILLDKIECGQIENYVQRNVETDNVVRRITEKKQNIIYIQGPDGIGKTTFIKQCIGQLMKQIVFDDIIWISGVTKFEEVRQRVYTNYLLSDKTDLNLLFHTIKTVLVLDDADQFLQSDSDEIISILELAPSSIIFISSTNFYSSLSYHSYNAVQSITLSPFTEQQVDELIGTHYGHVERSIREKVAQEANGIPRVILQILGQYSISDYHVSSDKISVLEYAQRQLLIFIPDSPSILLEDLYSLLESMNIDIMLYTQLVNLGYVSQSQGKVRSLLSPQEVAKQIDVKKSVESVFSSYLDLKQPWKIVCHILDKYDSLLTKIIKEKILKLYWRSCAQNGNRVRFFDILDSIEEINPILVSLAKAVMFRYSSDIDQAEEILIRIIHDTGRVGNFSAQAESIIELAKVNRLKGNLEQALVFIEDVNQNFKRFLTSEAINALMLEHVQILLTLGEITLAFALLKPFDSSEAQLLRGQAHYLIDDYSETIEICELLLDGYLTIFQRITVYNLLGQCNIHKNVEYAITQFNMAIQYAEINSDILYLSRSLINLSVALIRNEDFELAIDRLKFARKLCELTNDIIGIKTIERNQLHIRQLLSMQY